MEVNNIVAKVIYEDFFRGFEKIPQTGLYRFSIAELTRDRLQACVLRCDEAGYRVYDRDILHFIDYITNPGREQRECSYLPLSLVAAGEVLHILGTDKDTDVMAKISLLKLDAGLYLRLNTTATSDKNPSHDFVTLSEDEALLRHEVVAIGEKRFVTSSIMIELPTPFHRHLDHILLPEEYLSATPSRLLPLLNLMVDLDNNDSLGAEFMTVLEAAGKGGHSTFVVRKLLDYISGKTDE